MHSDVMAFCNPETRASVQLKPNEAHLWTIPLDDPIRAESLRELLDDTELLRGSRFYFASHRRRWFNARAAMRQILSIYLDRPPQSLAFETNKYGKPRLTAPHGTVHFNLAHSRGLGLFAVSTQAVGIDVEYADHGLDWQALARHVFSDAELELLACEPVKQRRQLFFRLWTHKEAYIKGRGLGLSLPLKAFSIRFKYRTQADVVVQPEWDDGEPWRVTTLSVKASYMAALAAATPIHATRRFKWMVAGDFSA